MGRRPKHKMPVSQRAKQFLAFEALKSFDDILKDKEYLPEPRKILAEDQADTLNQILFGLKPGINAKIEFYYNGHYTEQAGRIEKISEKEKYIILKNNIIHFEDIYNIEETL